MWVYGTTQNEKGSPYWSSIFWSPSPSNSQNVLNILQINILNH
jgi:hypothetical protein